LPRNRTPRRPIPLIGILSFHEAASPLRVLFIGMILVGAVGLNLTTRSH
jgi:multidrug transporter EmrE-like cation transporter